LAAIQAASAKVSAWIGSGSSVDVLIHTSSGWRQPLSGTATTSWMALAVLVVDIGSLLAICRDSTAVTLVRREELDATVAVLVVVPKHIRPHPHPRLLSTGKRPAGVG